MKDWKGSASFVSTNRRSSSDTDEDFYATHKSTVETFLDRIIADGVITDKPLVWEPCCGKGDISKTLEEYGFEVISTDLINRGYGSGGVDFFCVTPPNECGAIITNPPYSLAAECWERAYQILPDGGLSAFFLKLTFLETKKRRELFKRCPLSYVYVCSERQTCKKGGWEPNEKMPAGAVAYAWFVSIKGQNEETRLKWL
jgi:hypothetical protein